MPVSLKTDYSVDYHLVPDGSEDEARIDAGKAAYDAEDRQYTFEHRMAGRFKMLERITNPEYLPRRLRFEWGKTLPDFLESFPGGVIGNKSSPLVSTRVKSVIEAQKKGSDLWTFYPVDILHADGSPYATYHAWCVDRAVDAVDPACEGVETIRHTGIIGTHQWEILGVKSPDRQRLHEGVVRHLNAWVDVRLGTRFFVSDSLFEVLTENGFGGFEAELVWGLS